MSVSDPLIKEIKAHALNLFKENETSGKISDSSTNLVQFCTCLEFILFKGAIIINKNNFYGLRKPDLVGWMYQIAENENNVLLSYKTIVERLKRNKLCKNPLGKFRLLIRHCLMRKCVHAPIEALLKSGNVNLCYQKNSIIGDEILATILLSVLMQCNKLNFQLELENASFLDSTWMLPQVVKIELVPCKNLGLSVSFSDDKAVIVDVEPNSVASESDQITRGDILDTLNNIIIDGGCKGRLEHILHINKGKPINLTIIKAITSNDSPAQEREIFPPIKRLFDNLRIDYNNSIPKNADTELEIKQAGKCGYDVTYFGAVDVGCKGSIKQIEEAMKVLMVRRKNGGEKSWLEIGELGVKVFNCKSGQLAVKYSYMEISACGSPPNFPNYFAFINGNENCDSATRFMCHIFFTSKINEACIILQNIGQGFHRTHFAV